MSRVQKLPGGPYTFVAADEVWAEVTHAPGSAADDSRDALTGRPVPY
jgi:hypothetical protein